jgi:hypothetical protein
MYDQTQVLVWYFPYFRENSIVDCRIKLNHEVIKNYRP